MGWPCSTHGSDEKYIQSFIKNPEGKRPFRKPKHKWEDNINIYLKK
jgi:hypothetical protein